MSRRPGYSQTVPDFQPAPWAKPEMRSLLVKVEKKPPVEGGEPEGPDIFGDPGSVYLDVPGETLDPFAAYDEALAAWRSEVGE